MGGLILAAWSTWHIVLVVAIILLLFGGSKLPELARGLARGMRIFRDEMHGIKQDIDEPGKPLPPADPTAQKKDDTVPKA